MNEQYETARAIARLVADAYAHDPDVQAVLLCGSVARGWSDRWSDIELLICRDAAPSPELSDRVTSALGARQGRIFGRDPRTGAWEDELSVHGVKIDIAQMSSLEISKLLSSVTIDADSSVDKHAIVAGIRDSLTLYGGDLTQEWQQQAHVYPPGLRLEMIRSHCAFGPHWWPTMLADRNDMLPLYEILSRIGRRIMATLLALNSTYTVNASYKWSSRMATSMMIAPNDLPARLDAIFRLSPSEGVAEARSLIDETFSLVRAHAPEIDLESAYRRFTASRTF
jgi:hypothetical protein